MIVDFLLFIILGMMVYVSARDGLLWTLSRCLLVLGSVILAGYIHQFIYARLLSQLENPALANLLVFTTALSAVGTFLFFLTSFLRTMMKAGPGMSLLDRLIGGAIGLLVGAALGGLILISLVNFRVVTLERVEESRLGTPCLNSGLLVYWAMPNSWHESLNLLLKSASGEKVKPAPTPEPAKVPGREKEKPGQVTRPDRQNGVRPR